MILLILDALGDLVWNDTGLSCDFVVLGIALDLFLDPLVLFRLLQTWSHTLLDELKDFTLCLIEEAGLHDVGRTKDAIAHLTWDVHSLGHVGHDVDVDDFHDLCLALVEVSDVLEKKSLLEELHVLNIVSLGGVILEESSETRLCELLLNVSILGKEIADGSVLEHGLVLVGKLLVLCVKSLCEGNDGPEHDEWNEGTGGSDDDAAEDGANGVKDNDIGDGEDDEEGNDGDDLDELRAELIELNTDVSHGNGQVDVDDCDDGHPTSEGVVEDVVSSAALSLWSEGSNVIEVCVRVESEGGNGQDDHLSRSRPHVWVVLDKDLVVAIMTNSVGGVEERDSGSGEGKVKGGAVFETVWALNDAKGEDK